MLRKLMKYEFKATARMLLPLYGALIGFAIINKLFIGMNLDTANSQFLNGIPAMISMTAYGITMAAVIIVTFIIIIQRFYKNLLCDEGYLMNTLPISTWKNIASKLIVATIWNIVSLCVALVSILIMVYKPGVINEIISGISQLFTEGYNEVGVSVYMIAIEVIILGLVSTVFNTITIYTAISLGHLANKRKILSSFGAFIVLNMIINAIVGVVGSIFTMTVIDVNSLSDINALLISIIVISIAITAGLFAVCNYILKNKLNLE